jgi:hypothetical protein
MDGFLLHPLGLCVGTPHQQMLCKGYNTYSGVLGDLSQITLLITIVGLLLTAWKLFRRHFECHADGCSRLGVHPVEGTHFRTCWIHHPVLSQHPHRNVPLAHIHQAHAEAQRRE